MQARPGQTAETFDRTRKRQEQLLTGLSACASLSPICPKCIYLYADREGGGGRCVRENFSTHSRSSNPHLWRSQYLSREFLISFLGPITTTTTTRHMVTRSVLYCILYTMHASCIIYSNTNLYICVDRRPRPFVRLDRFEVHTKYGQYKKVQGTTHQSVGNCLIFGQVPQLIDQLDVSENGKPDEDHASVASRRKCAKTQHTIDNRLSCSRKNTTTTTKTRCHDFVWSVFFLFPSLFFVASRLFGAVKLIGAAASQTSVRSVNRIYMFMVILMATIKR